MTKSQETIFVQFDFVSLAVKFKHENKKIPNIRNFCYFCKLSKQ